MDKIKKYVSNTFQKTEFKGSQTMSTLYTSAGIQKPKQAHHPISSAVVVLPKVTMLFNSWTTQTWKIYWSYLGRYGLLELGFTGKSKELPQCRYIRV